MTRYLVDWPENCPPPEAEAASGTVYRVCRSNPPAPEDFKSHAELGKQSKGSECMCRGLSVFRDGAEARHLTRIFRNLAVWFSGENWCHNTVRSSQPQQGTDPRTRPGGPTPAWIAHSPFAWTARLDGLDDRRP